MEPFFQDFWPECQESLERPERKKKHKYQRPAKKAHRSQICQTAKGGWAAVIPPRGFQSAAHRRCAKRARLINAWFAQFAKILALNSASKLSTPKHRSFNPSFVLPRSLPCTGAPLQKSVFCPLGAFFGDFWPLRNALRNLLRKNIEKSALIEDFGFQNSPKTHPKRL